VRPGTGTWSASIGSMLPYSSKRIWTALAPKKKPGPVSRVRALSSTPYPYQGSVVVSNAPFKFAIAGMHLMDQIAFSKTTDLSQFALSARSTTAQQVLRLLVLSDCSTQRCLGP
jgi:hypothetical protein